MSMKKSLKRPPFISEKSQGAGCSMGSMVHEGRFGLSDMYDKSTYLTTSPRLKTVMPFEDQGGRDSDLMAKGGNSSITKSSLKASG